MFNPLPAVLIGGPPRAGKSVLLYSITHALRERGIRHHAIRACPDGEGNWFQEGDPETVSRVYMKVKGAWPDSFVERVCQALEHRCLPLLVDMGGCPQGSQSCILRLCTHSVLLLKAEQPENALFWQRLVAESDLQPLAQATSYWTDDAEASTSTIAAQSPLLEGTIKGLVRGMGRTAKGEFFDALVERIATLFTAYSSQEMERVFFEQASGEALNLYESLHAIDTTTTRWRPEMLPCFLESLPARTALSAYGVAPNWVYAALAAHSDPESLSLFDPRGPSRLSFGWVQPVAVHLGDERAPELEVHTHIHPDVTVLSISIPSKYLEYFQPDSLPFPQVPADRGLIIDGPLPFWLLTALVRLYKNVGVPWIAPYYVQANSSIVAYSRVPAYRPGNLFPMPVQPA